MSDVRTEEDLLELDSDERESSGEQESDVPVSGRRRRRRFDMSGLSPVRAALLLGLSFVVALTGLTGWLGYRAHEARQAEQFHALLVSVAKQGAVNLTTINFEHADADVKRILDSATGQFFDDFQTRSGPFIDLVKKVQSNSTGTVTEAGLESADDQQGQVLVAVTVKTSSKGAPDEQPRYWRMRMTVARQQDGAKVSNVEFVP